MIEARKGTEFGLQAHLILTKATLAQSVEQRIRNAQVASSSLVSGSRMMASRVSVNHLSLCRRGQIATDAELHGSIRNASFRRPVHATRNINKGIIG